MEAARIEKILIKGGRLVDPASRTDEPLDILVENGCIAAIGQFAPEGSCFVIDAGGLVVAPGLVDAHVHFREPGFTHKEDIATGAKAAAAGGFTTVICMANTRPPVDNAETLRAVLEAGSRTGINVLSIAAVSRSMRGEALTDMAGLKAAGAAGFSDDGIPLTDADFLRRAMLETKQLGAVLSLHEENPEMIGIAGVNDGAVSERLGFKGAPSASEASMIARDCALALETGAAVHVQHISCAESVALIRRAKAEGADITAEVTPQHISLTETAIRSQGSLAKLNPPLRTEADRLALIAGLKDGTIDFIATDHAPHTSDEKAKPLKDAPSGMIGLETALALGITNLVRPGHLTLSALIEKMSLAPARRYGLTAGRVATGCKADIVLFDPDEAWTVNGFLSKSSNSPFIGMRLYGSIKYTVCGGNIIYSCKKGEINCRKFC